MHRKDIRLLYVYITISLHAESVHQMCVYRYYIICKCNIYHIYLPPAKHESAC